MQAWQYQHHLVQAARHALYELGKPLKSVVVEDILKPHSLVPTVVSRNNPWSIQHTNLVRTPTECFHRPAFPSRFYHLPQASSRFVAWVRVGCAEVHTETLASHNLCGRSPSHRHFEWKVIALKLVFLNTDFSFRFTAVPPFGEAIRHFPDNILDTIQRPAWHFENVLQVRVTTLMQLGATLLTCCI